MQCRYVGDVGDFGKYGLLRALTSPPSRDVSLGVVWYLVPNHGPPGDGRYTDYLKNPDRFRPCDAPLFDCLKEIVDSGRRSVETIERACILPQDTAFYHKRLEFDGVPQEERQAHRRDWLSKAVGKMARKALVFVDPDNGLQVKSASRHSTKGTKYVYYDELHDYLSQGQGVVIYQHLPMFLPREKEEEYARHRGDDLRKCTAVDEVWALLWRPYSRRMYFIIPNGRAALLRPRIDAMLGGPWGWPRPEGPHFEPIMFS